MRGSPLPTRSLSSGWSAPLQRAHGPLPKLSIQQWEEAPKLSRNLLRWQAQRPTARIGHRRPQLLGPEGQHAATTGYLAGCPRTELNATASTPSFDEPVGFARKPRWRKTDAAGVRRSAVRKLSAASAPPR